ncbi:hypothetical protein ACFQL0_04650 [Haloplanus litoreus]|uniref:hypothetical protein n=1 Tax=Haloplanus litoreus TaxID=767515 RepID=UPI003623B80D
MTYRERGEHALGPAAVSARDVLGLARRTFVTEDRDAVLVYPRVFYPSTAVSERLRGLAAPDEGAERGAFDHLREYARGDSFGTSTGSRAPSARTWSSRSSPTTTTSGR